MILLSFLRNRLRILYDFDLQRYFAASASAGLPRILGAMKDIELIK